MYTKLPFAHPKTQNEPVHVTHSTQGEHVYKARAEHATYHLVDTDLNPTVIVDYGKGRKVEMVYPDFTCTSHQANEHIVSLNAVEDNVQIKYSTFHHSLKQEIILRAKPNNDVITEIIYLKGLDLKEIDGIWNLVDKSGEVIAWFAVPTVVDSATSRALDGNHFKAEFTRISKSTYRFSLTLDKNFLSKAHYPVIIDPTITTGSINSGLNFNNNRTIFTLSNGDIVNIACNQQQVFYTVSHDGGTTWDTAVNTGLSSYGISSFAGAINSDGSSLFVAAAYPNVGVKIAAFDYNLTSLSFISSNIISQNMYRNFTNVDLAWNDAGFLHLYTVDNTGSNTYLTGFSCSYKNETLLLLENQTLAFFAQDNNAVCAATAGTDYNYVLIAVNNQLQLLAYGAYFSAGAKYNELVNIRVRSVGQQYACSFVPDTSGALHIIYSTGANTAEYVVRTGAGAYSKFSSVPLNIGNSNATSMTNIYQGQLAYETSNNSLVFVYNANFNTGNALGVLSLIIGTLMWEPYDINLDYPGLNYSIMYISMEPKFYQIWKSGVLFDENNQYIDKFLSGELQPTLYVLTSIVGETYDKVVPLSWDMIYVDNITFAAYDSSNNLILSDNSISGNSYDVETLGWSNGQYKLVLTPYKNGTSGIARVLEITILHEVDIKSLSPIYSRSLFFINKNAVGGIATWNTTTLMIVPNTSTSTGGIFYYDSLKSTSWTSIYNTGLTTYADASAGQGGLTIVNKVAWGLYVDTSLNVQLYSFTVSENPVQSLNFVGMYDTQDQVLKLDAASFAIGTDGTNILIYDGVNSVIRIFGTTIDNGYVRQIGEIPITYSVNTSLNHQFGFDGVNTYWANSDLDLVKYDNNGNETIISNVFSSPFNYISYEPIYNTISGCVINNGQVSQQQVYTVSSNYLLPPLIIEPAQGQVMDKKITLFWQQPEDPYSTVTNYNWFLTNSSNIIPSGSQGTITGASLTLDLSDEGVFPNGNYAFYVSAIDANGAQSANAELNFTLLHSVAPSAPTITFTSNVSNIDIMNATVSFNLSTQNTGTNMTGYVYWIENAAGIQLFNPRTVVAASGAQVLINANLVGASNGTYYVKAYATGVDRENDVITSATTSSSAITINAQFASPEIISWPADSISIDSNAIISWQVIFSPYDGRIVENYYYHVNDSKNNLVIPTTFTDNTMVSLSARDFLSGPDVNETYTFYVYGVDSLNDISPASSQTIAFTPTNVLINYDVVYPLASGSQQLNSIGIPVFYQYPGDDSTPSTVLTFSTYIREYVGAEHNVTTSYCQWYVVDANGNFVGSDTATYLPTSSAFEYSDAIAMATINLDAYNLQDGLMYTLYVQQVTDKYSAFSSIAFFANQNGDATYFAAPGIMSVPNEYAANLSATFSWAAPEIISNGALYSGTTPPLTLQNYYYEVVDIEDNNVYVNPTLLVPSATYITVDTSDTKKYLDGNVYKFLIKALSNSNTFGFTNSMNFLVNHSTILSLPDAPVWILPISNTGNTMNPKPHFQFKLIDPLGNNIEGFRLQVASDQNFNNVVFDSQDVHQPVASNTVVSYIPTQNVIPNTAMSASYYVRVYGWNNNGNGLPSFPLQINFQAASWMPLTDKTLTVDFINQMRTTIEASLEFYGLPIPTWTPIRLNGVIKFSILEELFNAINILLKQENVNAKFVLHRGSVLRASDLVSLETNIMNS